jgi:hypothetical protein
MSSSPVQQAFSNVAKGLKYSTITDKKDTIALINDYVNMGDMDNARTLVTNKIISSMNTEEANQTMARMGGIESVKYIKGLLENYKASGGDTNILVGTAQQIASKIGKTYKNDPALQELATTINVKIFDYRRAISGAAFTETEGKAYQDLFPSIGSDFAVNLTKIDALQNSWQNSIDGSMRARMGEKNYNVIFGNNTDKINNYLQDIKTNNNFAQFMSTGQNTGVFAGTTGKSLGAGSGTGNVKWSK